MSEENAKAVGAMSHQAHELDQLARSLTGSIEKFRFVAAHD
jgi:methyl-accepting chemotaxis protein